jgi:hypothetical protein
MIAPVDDRRIGGSAVSTAANYDRKELGFTAVLRPLQVLGSSVGS